MVARLRERAGLQPDRIALRFLGERSDEESTIDYGTLDRRARALAALLIERGAAGERVLVLHSPGLDYVCALFGCLYAGAVAVPAYPPRAGRPLLRLRSIIADSKATFALTSPSILDRIGRRRAEEPELAKLSWIALESIDESMAAAWPISQQTEGGLAILQYTSGSTSEPKGVMLNQGHFTNNVEALVAHGGLIAEDRVVSWLPPYHDMGLLSAILLPVCTGTEAILMSPSAFLQQPLRWLTTIARYRGTISGAPNFAYDLCVRRVTPAQREALDLSCWRVAFSGAERVRAETVERFTDTFAASGFDPNAFTPCYGLAEATLGVSFSVRQQGPVIRDFDARELGQGRACDSRRGEPARRLVSAGQVLPGYRVEIVNPETMRSEREGTVGEIWVSGASVATGYYGQEASSERVFRARLAQLDPHNRAYLRTGDLGFSVGGELFVTGRIKDLVILRGVNHYPEDIEATAEQSHVRLRPAGGAACCIEVASEDRLVIVHEVDAIRDLPGEEIAAALRLAVAEAHDLPVYEVVLVGPAALLKTSSGKVRRHAIAQTYLDGTLPAVARFATLTGAELSAAPAELVTRVSRLMAEVLNIDVMQPNEDFFELGGHSLMATQLASRVHRTLNVQLPLALIFEAPTPATLAAKIAALPSAEPLPPVTRCDRSQPLPLSYSQERMWFLNQVEPGGSAYNVAGAVTLEGAIDESALMGAFQAVLLRHEVLRSNYVALEGTPVVRIRAALPLDFERADLAHDPRPDARAKILASELAHRPFDIANELLIRGGLYRLAPMRHVLCIAMHHLITDGWSMGILTREVLELYAELSVGRTPAPRDEQIQYADYAAWQRQYFSGTRLARDLEYWRAELAGVPALELPFDLPAPEVPTSRGALHSVELPPELLSSLRELGLKHGSTLFMVTLTAFQVLLHRYSGQTDLVLGVPIANRNQFASEPFIGTLVNTLALRVQFEPEVTFTDLLQRTRASALDAYAHQDLPFERLVAELPFARNSGRSPLIQAMFDFQNAPLTNLDAASFRIKPFVISRGASQFDLSVLILDTAIGQSLGFEYSTDRFSAEAVARLAGHYLSVLHAVLTDPTQHISRIDLLGEPERHALLETASRTCSGTPASTPVHWLVSDQARRTPAASAVYDEQSRWSYAELEQHSDTLASELQARGAGPGDKIAVFLDRSRDLPVALLAVLKTGAAYIPLDPRYPSARVEQVLEDADPRLILTHSALEQALPEALRGRIVRSNEVALGPGEPLRPCAIEPEMAAYVIYTSGSTGRPKGVEVSHGGLANFLDSMAAEPGIASTDVLLSVTTVAFDISGLELFLPLVNGAAVYLASSEVASDGTRLRELVERPELTIMQATPATWKLLIEAGFTGKKGFRILCGGEALPRDLADQLLARADSVWNLYGPTETTIWSTVHRVRAGVQPIPIGCAILHTRLYVLDLSQNLAPFGAIGEIYIGGAGVANGYLNRPDLTAERFFADPFSELPRARMYRTGDLGRLRRDGTLEYLGRADFQLKLRGFRIEPGEIEAVLKQQAGVRDAVVIAREDQPGDWRLVAYYVAVTAGAEMGAELRGVLAQRLPEYMVPAAFVAMTSLPQTPNGKLDRKHLPPPAAEDLVRVLEFLAPRDELEADLERIWRGVLGGTALSVRDNFFLIGGHSLLALRLLSRIRKELDLDLPVATLLQGPTIELQAQRVRELRAAPAAKRVVETEPEAAAPVFSFLVPIRKGPTRTPLFCVHGAGGDVLSLREIGQELGAEFDFYGLQARGVDGLSAPFTRIEEMATAYLVEIRTVQPQGPYHLSGYCGGGLVAFEMANQLRASGEAVATLVLLDSHRPGSTSRGPRLKRWREGFLRGGLRYLRERSSVFLRRESFLAWARLIIFLHRVVTRPIPHELRNIWLMAAFFRAESQYRPPVYPGQLTLFRPVEAGTAERDGGHAFGWTDFATGGVEIQEVPGNHDTLTKEPNVSVVAAKLKACVSNSASSKQARR